MNIKTSNVITQASCKFTSSVLAYLDKMGLPNSRLFELFDYPEEFLRDSHNWLSLADAEKFFQIAGAISEDLQIGRSAGLQVYDLQSWGALDNVFKMMGEDTKTYYSKLDRFFSYFLAPIIEFKELEKTDEYIKFVFPFEKSLYPHLHQFLIATLEVLPRYTGKPAASIAVGADNEVTINWESGQVSFFGLGESVRVVNPKLVDQMSKLLEQSQHQIEDLKLKNQRLQAQLKDQMRSDVFAEKMTGLAVLASGVSHEINNPLSFVMSNLSRFKEYFESLQKYLDEMKSMAPLDVQRKHDLDFILSEAPLMLEESLQGLTRVKEIVKDLSSMAHPENGKKVRKNIASSGSFLPMEK